MIVKRDLLEFFVGTSLENLLDMRRNEGIKYNKCRITSAKMAFDHRCLCFELEIKPLMFRNRKANKWNTYCEQLDCLSGGWLNQMQSYINTAFEASWQNKGLRNNRKKVRKRFNRVTHTNLEADWNSYSEALKLY